MPPGIKSSAYIFWIFSTTIGYSFIKFWKCCFSVPSNINGDWFSPNTRSYSRKWGHACSITGKEQESSVKGHNYDFFLSKFSKFRAFGMLHPPKWPVVLKVFTENKLMYFSKRALRAGNTNLVNLLISTIFESRFFIQWNLNKFLSSSVIRICQKAFCMSPHKMMGLIRGLIKMS